MTSVSERVSAPATRTEWRKALDDLPSTPDNIPAFFFAHGSPRLVYPNPGPLEQFLRDFGPALLQKYQPKGIVVFSAHWETTGERLGAMLSGRSDQIDSELKHPVQLATMGKRIHY